MTLGFGLLVSFTIGARKWLTLIFNLIQIMFDEKTSMYVLLLAQSSNY
jgi:hypothetical protein